MKLYQKIGTYALIGATAFGLMGCDKREGMPEQTPKVSDRPTYTRQIDNFGVTPYQNPFNRGWEDRAHVAVADMDGDGDLDVIVANSFGEVIVLENKIPQKK